MSNETNVYVILCMMKFHRVIKKTRAWALAAYNIGLQTVQAYFTLWLTGKIYVRHAKIPTEFNKIRMTYTP